MYASKKNLEVNYIKNTIEFKSFKWLWKDCQRCDEVVVSNEGVNLVQRLTKQPDKDHYQLKLHSFSLTMDYDSIIFADRGLRNGDNGVGRNSIWLTDPLA